MRCLFAFRGYGRVYALVGWLSIFASQIGSAQTLPPLVARTTIYPLFVHWQPQVPYQHLTLNVAVPDGRVLQQQFAPGEAVGFSLTEGGRDSLPDGQYTYELVVTPLLAPAVQHALSKTQETGDHSLIEELQRQGLLPRRSLTQTGYFSVIGGSIVMPTDAE